MNYIIIERKMNSKLLTIIFSGFTLLTLDFIYLFSIKNYFKNQIEIIQKTPFILNMYSVLLCYIIIIFGINYFIIIPNKSVFDAFLLGIFVYGVYETTTMSLFTKWKWTTVALDTIWGGILFALTTFITKYIKNKFIKS